MARVTYNSHGSRVAKAIGGALVGLVIFFISPFVLFFNEGRAVQTEKSLTEGSGKVVSVAADKVDGANEGKLVHLSGLATTDETLADPDFEVSANAIKLIRTVEMYQWKETKKEEEKKRSDGSSYTITSYEYDKVWDDELVDSTTFDEQYDHENPAQMRFVSATQTAKKVTLGAFMLSPEQVGQISKSAELPVDAAKITELKALEAVAHEGGIYLGKNPAAPVVGDIRVNFKQIAPLTVSVIAQQSGGTFVPYQTQAGDALLLLRESAMAAPQMFEAAQSDNVAMTWVLRFVGWLMMFIGLSMMFRPVAVIGDRFPLLGTLAGAGVAFSAFLIASGLSLVTVALAWLFFRPLMGILLLAVAGGAGYLFVRRVKKAKAEKANDPAARPPAEMNQAA